MIQKRGQDLGGVTISLVQEGAQGRPFLGPDQNHTLWGDQEEKEEVTLHHPHHHHLHQLLLHHPLTLHHHRLHARVRGHEEETRTESVPLRVAVSRGQRRLRRKNSNSSHSQ